MVLHGFVLAVCFMKRGKPRFCCLSWRWILNVVLLLDAIFLALSDNVVEAEANESLHASAMFEVLGGVPRVDAESLPHPYKSNAVFQFHSLYMGLFVVNGKHISFIMPLTVLVYTVIVLSAYEYSYQRVGTRTRKDAEIELWLEFILIALTTMFVVIAKKMMERSQRPLYLDLEHKKEEVIKEKVMRCRAEFKNSHFEEILHKAPVTRMLCGPNVPMEVSPMQPSKPHSTFSCPPFIGTGLRPKQQHEREGVDCKGGDCLPEDTLVYVDGLPMPQPICAVKAKQRVLCYDDLVGSVSYVPVDKIGISEPHAQPDRGAVRVQLLDNTELLMTGNHPVKAYPTVNDSWDAVGAIVQGSGRCARAADLEAGHDSLIVLKTAAVPVKKVEQVPLEDASGEHRRWVTVSVQGPQRHTIFTATKGSQLAPCQMMAVGGSNLLPLHEEHPPQKHTFIHFSVDDSEKASSRHTVSAPPTIAATSMEAQAPTELAASGAMAIQFDDEVSNLSTIVSVVGDIDEVEEPKKPKGSFSSLAAAAVAASCGNRRRQQQRARRREARVARATNADNNSGCKGAEDNN